MIALHAWRSASSVARYRARHPKGPLIVALGGTDVNTFLKSDPEVTENTMDEAHALVCLHDLISDALPQRFENKLHVVKQSALPLPRPRQPSIRHFDVCVVGHLRDEKDPFRTALAARQLPETSRLRVIHLGKAHTPTWARQAAAEMKRNPRYLWKGEVPTWRVRREYARTHLMVISSNQEGGANVVSEALVAGVPVIASDIPGNIGLLGQDYHGYYPVGDETALAVLLHRAETDPKFLKGLVRHGRQLRESFLPHQEAAGWHRVVKLVS